MEKAFDMGTTLFDTIIITSYYIESLSSIMKYQRKPRHVEFLKQQETTSIPILIVTMKFITAHQNNNDNMSMVCAEIIYSRSHIARKASRKIGDAALPTMILQITSGVVFTL